MIPGCAAPNFVARAPLGFRYARVDTLRRASGEIIIGEFRLFQSGVNINSLATKSIGAAISSGNVNNLFDGTLATYNSYNSDMWILPTCYIQWDFGGNVGIIPNQVQWGTNNSFGNRWMVSCRLILSNDVTFSTFTIAGTTPNAPDPGLGAYTAVYNLP